MPLDDPRLERAIADLLPMSVSLAWAFFTRAPGADLDELKSITAEALVWAAHHWVDPYCSSRGYWPWDEDDPAKPEKHFSGFAIKRMRGALLDAARSADRLTRTQRKAVKALDAAQDDGIRGEEEQAAAAGLTVAKAREARAAAALMTVSLDDHASGTFTGTGMTLADDSCEGDVEGQVAVNGILAGFLEVFDALPAEQQVVLALTYHAELEPAVIAKELRTSEQRVTELHDAAVCRIHSALLRSVQDEGTGPRQPAPPQVVHVSSADTARAAESAAPDGKRCAACGQARPVGEFGWWNRAAGIRAPYDRKCEARRQKRIRSARAQRAA